MKKNINLYAWLLALCLTNFGIMFAIEERMQHETAHETRETEHQSESKKREEQRTERESRQKEEINQLIEKHATERKELNKTTAAAQDAKNDLNRIKEKAKDINHNVDLSPDILDPKKATDKLKNQHITEAENLSAKHEQENATASKETDNLADAFGKEENKKTETKNAQDEAKTEKEDESNPSNEKKPSDEPSLTPSEKKEQIAQIADAQNIVLQIEDLKNNSDSTFDNIDPKEINDLKEAIKNAEKAQGNKRSFMDIINDLLSNLMDSLKKIDRNIIDPAVRATVDKINSLIDGFKEKLNDFNAKREETKAEKSKKEETEESKNEQKNAKEPKNERSKNSTNLTEDEALGIFGLEKGASWQDVRDAYKKEALKNHPDKWAGNSADEISAAEKRFKEGQNAYDKLKDIYGK